MATLETWNGRAASQTDADSPLDTTLMDGIRKDLDHLRQVLYGNNAASGTYFTPVWGHDHDGSNSKALTIPNGSITGAKISKSIVSSGSQSQSIATYWTPAAGIYNVVIDHSLIVSDAYGGLRYQIYVSSAWRNARATLTSGSPYYIGFFGGSGMIFDGTNQRFFVTDAVTFYYQTF